MSAADSVKRDAAEQVEASNDSMDAHSEKADATTARELKDAVHLAVGNGEMPEAGQSPPPAAATTTTTTSTMGEHETSPVVSVHTIPGKGRGVFAGQDIARGTEIEEAPCIAFPPPQYAAHLKVSRDGITRDSCFALRCIDDQIWNVDGVSTRSWNTTCF